MAKVCRRCDREFTDIVRSCPEHGRTLVRFRDLRLRPGDLLDDRFVVLNRVGVGAAGDVYRARWLDGDRVVALKVLRAADPRSVRRFEYEARVLSKLSHPSIVPVSEVRTTEAGRHYMVMPLVTGRTLREVLDAEAPLGPVRSARLMLQLASALLALHEAGVVHLDVKPTNIIVTRVLGNREHLTIVDFGIAVDLRDEAADGHRVPGAGTPGYISPEQAKGERADTRADLYSLGIVLSEMLTGERLFGYDDARAALEHTDAPTARAIRETHPTLRVPDALDALVLALLERDPERRPRISDALAVLEGIAREPEEEGLEPTPPQLASDEPPHPEPLPRRPSRGARLRSVASAFTAWVRGWGSAWPRSSELDLPARHADEAPERSQEPAADGLPV